MQPPTFDGWSLTHTHWRHPGMPFERSEKGMSGTHSSAAMYRSRTLRLPGSGMGPGSRKR